MVQSLAAHAKAKVMSTVLHANCDAAAARVTRREAPVAHPNLVLAATILASSLAFIDGSVVNVGLPAIGRSLSADAGALQWVINAYLLPLSALLLLGGAAGDRCGRRRILIAGILLFALASLACAAAPSIRMLLAGRSLQGSPRAITFRVPLLRSREACRRDWGLCRQCETFSHIGRRLGHAGCNPCRTGPAVLREI